MGSMVDDSSLVVAFKGADGAGVFSVTLDPAGHQLIIGSEQLVGDFIFIREKISWVDTSCEKCTLISRSSKCHGNESLIPEYSLHFKSGYTSAGI